MKNKSAKPAGAKKNKSANASVDVEDDQDQDNEDDEAVEGNEHSNVLQPIAQGRGPAKRSARATKKVSYAEL